MTCTTFWPGLTSVLFCHQICISQLWEDSESEGDWCIPLLPPPSHPGLPCGQPGQQMFLQKHENHQELHNGWSAGLKLLSRWSVTVPLGLLQNILIESHCFPITCHFEMHFCVSHLNRKTNLHLSAPFPSWQSVTAGGRTGPQPPWGVS